MPDPSSPPVVGAAALWSSSDTAGLGDQLLPWLVRAEIGARLSGWRITTLAPLGWNASPSTAVTETAEPLGPSDDGRRRRLAEATTLTLVAPSFPLAGRPGTLAARYGDDRAEGAAALLDRGLGADLETDHPVVWSGVRVSSFPSEEVVRAAARQPRCAVRDRRSRTRLLTAARRLDPAVELDPVVLPHPGVLAGRWLDDEAMTSLRRQLRQLGRLPADDGYVVLPGAVPGSAGPELVERLTGRLRRALASAGRPGAVPPVVVLPTGPEVADGAGWLVDTPSGEAYRLPAGLVVEDRLAVLAGASLVVAGDEHTAAAAAGLDTPWVLFDPEGEDSPVIREFGRPEQVAPTLGGLPSAVRAALAPGDGPSPAAVARRRLDEHFDAVALIAEETLARRGGHLDRRAVELAAENTALREANSRLRQRLLAERGELVEALTAAWRRTREARGETDQVRDELAAERAAHAAAAAREAELRRELEAWQHTKLVRWTRPLRDAYGKVRDS
ncbi:MULTISPECIES: hypothetical protein [Actinoalloteichus]|uniref:hypothetical protein n=1 Tax=Actinoalloteichus TaxID=65496 RepID=UPI0004146432|nr:hypothetical protein [Actinoalloteichus caeruleus]